jgi:hypothetical protein
MALETRFPDLAEAQGPLSRENGLLGGGLLSIAAALGPLLAARACGPSLISLPVRKGLNTISFVL